MNNIIITLYIIYLICCVKINDHIVFLVKILKSIYLNKNNKYM